MSATIALDPYLIQLPQLEDSIIEAVDEEGRELLRFATSWSGHRILVRYPRGFETWDRYCRDVALLVQRLGTAFEDIELPVDGKMKASAFTELAAAFLMHRRVGKLVEKIFFEYFTPEIEGCKSDDEAREWCRRNAPLDATARMFCAFLSPEDCIKKNMRWVGAMAYRLWTRPQYSDSSTKNGESTPSAPASSLFSRFASFSQGMQNANN